MVDARRCVGRGDGSGTTRCTGARVAGRGADGGADRAVSEAVDRAAGEAVDGAAGAAVDGAVDRAVPGRAPGAVVRAGGVPAALAAAALMLAACASPPAAPLAAPVPRSVPAASTVCPMPAFPDGMGRSDAAGLTRVTGEVQPDGSVRSVVVVRSSGPTRAHKLLDRAAADALSKCRFPPAPGTTPATTTVDYRWTLD